MTAGLERQEAARRRNSHSGFSLNGAKLLLELVQRSVLSALPEAAGPRPCRSCHRVQLRDHATRVDYHTLARLHVRYLKVKYCRSTGELVEN